VRNADTGLGGDMSESNTLEIVFATRSVQAASAFERYVRLLGKEQDPVCYFRLYRNPDGKPFVAVCLDSLITMLAEKDPVTLMNTIAIIDYCDYEAEFRELDTQDRCLSGAARLFLAFPEIRFCLLRPGGRDIKVFDESVMLGEDGRFFGFINSLDEILAMGNMLRRGGSLFDSSGIRNILKRKIFEKVEMQDNYERLHQSRNSNIAITVDEEPHYSLYWAYLLYRSGYSVYSICTYQELLEYKELLESKETGAKPDLVCRDYDLQFRDMPAAKGDEEQKIYELRGLTKSESHDKWELNRNYWDTFLRRKTAVSWIISQASSTQDYGSKTLKGVIPKPSVVEKLRDRHPCAKRYGILIHEATAKLLGQCKDLEGNEAIMDCREIRKIHADSRDYQSLNKSRKNESGHSVPAYNSDISQSLLGRAEQAYNNRAFLQAALLSLEAEEILNGLSKMSVLKAFHLRVKAEAKLELSHVGIGNLKERMRSKIYEIRRELERICRDADIVSSSLWARIFKIRRWWMSLFRRSNAIERNARMQVFNDMRAIYEDREQFEAAEALYAEVVKAELGIRDINYYALRRMEKRSRHENKRTKAEEKETANNEAQNGKVDIDCSWENTKLMRRIMGYLKYNKISYSLKKINLRDLCALLFHNKVLWLALALVWSIFHQYGYLSHPHPLDDIEVNLIFIGYFLIMFISIWKWKRTLYMILGAGTNMAKLAIGFLVFNLICMSVYRSNFNLEAGERKILPYNVFLSTLINQPAAVDQYIIKAFGSSESMGMNAPGSRPLLPIQRTGLFILLIYHMLGSVFFLGIIISIIYRRFTRR
jgi:hypothetical protein